MPMSDDRELYRWQLDALISWLRCGRRGVIEAVSGSGKTDVAIAAAADALRRGRFVLIVVPSRVLMEQWQQDESFQQRYREIMLKKRDEWRDRESNRKLVD